MSAPTHEEAIEFYGTIHLGDMEGEMTEVGWRLVKLNKFGAYAKAGAVVGDVLVVVEGKRIVDLTFAESMGVLMQHGVGATVKFGILRGNQQLVLNVKLKKRRTLSFDIDEADVDLRKIAPA